MPEADPVQRPEYQDAGYAGAIDDEPSRGSLSYFFSYRGHPRRQILPLCRMRYP